MKDCALLIVHGEFRAGYSSIGLVKASYGPRPRFTGRASILKPFQDGAQ